MEYANNFNNNYKRLSLSEIVTKYVKNKILSGEYKSGDKLIETDISSELNVSRAPVRESLRELNVEGVITSSPGKGCQVLDITREDAFELFSIRITLEIQVLKLIYQKNLMKEKDYNYLYNLIDTMYNFDDSTLEQNDRIYMINTTDISFHSYLWELSGSKRRKKILESLFFQLLIVMNRDVASLGTFKEKALEHKEMINSFKSGNMDKVITAFKNHLNVYVNTLVGADTNLLDYFIAEYY